ncbi:MAG: BBP7 family outer membrane beta-barrel protein [Planctomycetales bacterium]|nr:BBP7 family outer membrane beta-barrel protein [Planctomycetales bacterium]
MTSPVGCDVDAVGYSACRPPSVWYFSASGLIMGRDKPGRVWTTYENNNNPNQLMSTDNADPDWEGGIEAHVGRQFACGAWAVDLGYWTIDDLTASSSQTHANYVSTPLLFNDLEFGVADPVQDYFDSAEEHRIARRNTIQNLEVNLIEGFAGCSSCCPWRCRKSLGVRYFQFDEDLSLSTLDQGGTWGGNGGADEVTLSESIENNLLGVQLGCQLERQCGCQATFFIAPKFGIYNNRIEQRFDLRRGDGVAAMPSAASGVIGTYPVNSSRDVVSFLTEVNLGYSYQPNCHWSLFGGYRVMAMTGMGLADSQIPQYIIDIPEIADIDYQDALVLHGAFFGVAYSR